VNIWTDTPLQDQAEPSDDNPTPYDTGYRHEPILWGDVEPGLDEVMLALGGVWLKSAKDAETAYPGVVVESSLKDARTVRNPYRESIVRNPYSPPSPPDSLPPIQEVPTALTVRYRREGKGRKPSIAVFLPGGFERRSARMWLEERLGPLAALVRSLMFWRCSPTSCSHELLTISRSGASTIHPMSVEQRRAFQNGKSRL
jgi:hypothetical protein